MNKRELKLGKYGISGKRYKELCAFCEQYPEWKLELESNTNTIKSKEITDIPIPPHNQGDPTGNLAVRLATMNEKCRLIEEIAKEAAPDLWTYLIKSVCFEQPYWYIQDIMRIPCSKNSFYGKRRYFFYLLDQRRP